MAIANILLHALNDLMTKKTQLLTWVVVLGIFDAVVPLFPILALVLVYVLLERPPWFLSVVKEIYHSD